MFTGGNDILIIFKRKIKRKGKEKEKKNLMELDGWYIALIAVISLMLL